MRLKDLIPEVSYLVPRKYWSRVNLLAEEKSIIQSQDINATEDSSSLVQAIPLPEDPTRIARGLLNQINWQYATITRLNKNSLRNELIAFNLGAAIKENDPEENHILKAGDIITIYNQEDVPVPKAQRDSLVALKGEVVNPGVYRINPGETLPELIGRAGGVTPDAYLYASVFTRVTVQRDQKVRLEAGMARVEKEIAQATAALQARTMSPDIKNIVAAQMQARAKTIGILRATVATGRVTLQLDRESDTLQSLPKIELEDGDAFVVPSKMNEVHIMGEVYNQQSTLWNENSDVVSTMAAAGGPTKHADMKELFVIRADGTVVSYGQKGRGFIHLPIYEGDTLVVPEKLDFANWKYELKEWVKIFSDFAIGAAAIRVLQD
jgi:protein involved in polysaccharide export with SLBB domain